MLRYLLDTNVLSHLLKHPAGSVAAKVAGLDGSEICTTIIVACELRYGARKKGSPNLAGKVDRLLQSLDVVPLETGIDDHYAEIRVALERPGTPIGPNDLLIAAHARALNLTLVTGNTDEFSRVPGLRVENWLED